jgi:hypothetical protein
MSLQLHHLACATAINNTAGLLPLLRKRVSKPQTANVVWFPQAAAEKLHQQLSLVGQPHSFLIKQLAAAEANAAAAQSELAATKVRGAQATIVLLTCAWWHWAQCTSNGLAPAPGCSSHVSHRGTAASKLQERFVEKTAHLHWAKVLMPWSHQCSTCPLDIGICHEVCRAVPIAALHFSNK